MTRLLDKLNLRPGERRLVVGVGIVVFIVLNVWLVWPSFGEWGRLERQIKEARKKLKMFDEELARTNLYQRQMIELRQKGQYVATDEQASQLQREVTSQAALSGVQITHATPGRGVASGRTNAFFEEQVLTINVVAGEKELIDFLYNLGARSSLIRVLSMDLGRDPTQTKLAGNITLVESFQKKPPPKLVAAATPAAAPKPTTAPASPAPARPTGAPAGTTAVASASKPSAAAAAKPAGPAPAPGASVTSAPPATMKPAPTKSTNVSWLRRLFSRRSSSAPKPRSSAEPSAAWGYAGASALVRPESCPVNRSEGLARTFRSPRKSLPSCGHRLDDAALASQASRGLRIAQIAPPAAGLTLSAPAGRGEGMGEVRAIGGRWGQGAGVGLAVLTPHPGPLPVEGRGGVQAACLSIPQAVWNLAVPRCEMSRLIAQTGSLPCRGWAIGSFSRLAVGDTADCQSALQPGQTAALPALPSDHRTLTACVS